MIKLSSYLLRTRTLISLDLTNNQISGEGGFALSLVIKENTGLKLIKLAMNRFDDQNASLILKALTKNTLLEEIDLSSNEIGIMVIEIWFYLRLEDLLKNYLFIYLFKYLDKQSFIILFEIKHHSFSY